MTDGALPTGWRRADQPDDEMTRYNPQPVTEYEHTETDVGVQLIPINSQAGSASENDYRINVLFDVADTAGGIELLTTAPDHGAARDVARRFMQAYNDRVAEDITTLDTLMREFSGAG
jgi:hypothetical protein